MRTWGRRLALGLVLGLLCVLGGVAAATPMVQNRFFTTRDGVRLHYIEAGSGDKTIVFVPGWTMPAWIFDRQIAYFSEHYHVIALDPRGQGQSQVALSGYDQDRRGADVGDLIAHVDENEAGSSPLLVGWSLGVLDVLAYVHESGGGGLAGLVLIDNSVGENPAPLPAKSRKWAPPLPWDREMRRFVSGMFARSPGQVYLDRLTQSALHTPEWAAKRLLAYPVPRSYWRDALYTVPAPILYVVTPRLRGQAASVALHPNAQSVIFSGTGHALFVDEADKFNATMQAFISSKIWQ